MSALLLLAASALAFQDSAEARGDRLVKLDLLADRAAVRPGESFSLGVRFRVDPQWHIYWENHGDSGFPTRAEITGPEGFVIGELRYPGPERHVSEGDIVTYVHQDEVVLVADVRAPAEVPKELAKASFQVEARWLVCMEACYPGSAEARIEIPIAGAGAQSPPANEKLFAGARARLPRPWSELRGASIEWRGDEEGPIAIVAVPGADDLDFFPLASETTDLEERTVERKDAREGGVCRLTATLSFRKSATEDAPRLQGVLRVRKEQGESFYRMDSSPNRPAADVRPR